jgi:dTDP-4-amino-4,6-dideoxygalactose transaminase/predicted dehydrogenase
MKTAIRKLRKVFARQIIGRLPPSPARLTGPLAAEGGRPVRDVRLRPWVQFPNSGNWPWIAQIGPIFKQIFLSGREGLPQPLAKEFCRKWANYCGASEALLVPHGTDALRLGIAAALDHDGLTYGGEIIVPNVSFIASAFAALDRRCGVVLVDVDPGTLNIDPARVEEAIDPARTRAIMAVHLFGQPAEMVALREIARRHSLKLIEDAAQAHGAIHELGPVGSLGDVAAFSFQSHKNLPSGEGGALTTSDTAISERAYQLHNVGRPRVGGERWGHVSLGWNCRASEYVAAVLLHRFEHLELEQQRRFDRFLSLRSQLAEISCLQPLDLKSSVRRHGVHMFVMRYRPEKCGGLDIGDFVRTVQAEGIPLARAYDMTLAQQPGMQLIATKHPDYVRILPTPVADQAVKELIYLPHHIFLGTEADLAEIAAAFRKVQRRFASPAQQPPRATGAAHPATTKSILATTDLGNQTPARISSVERIRFGIIGMGIMGREHAAALTDNPRAILAGVTDADCKVAQEGAAKFSSNCFASAEHLIHSGEIDAIVIATPHWQHAKLTVLSLKAGLHVACEKPLTVTVAQADQVLRTAAESESVFAVVHQLRFEPAYQYAKKLLNSGELGPCYRCLIVDSAWRTGAYYRSGPWRGTWKGEGGGVLLNQAPHVLDRYAWLCGMPESVIARCDTNLHDIEVEDTATAILRHANGAHGCIHVSTVEYPPISQTVLSCDRGRIVIENGRVRISTLSDSIRERTKNDTQVFGASAYLTREIAPSPERSFQTPLSAFYDNFIMAIAGEESLVCPGPEGCNAVELANAMILSSFRGSPVSLPVDREQYSQLIDKLSESHVTGHVEGELAQTTHAKFLQHSAR